MGLLSSIFKKDVKNTEYPVISEIGFKEFAEEINNFPRTYAHVFTKDEGSLDIESGIMWMGIKDKRYRLYISKCELVT